jgi:hypothetical protein
MSSVATGAYSFGEAGLFVEIDAKDHVPALANRLLPMCDGLDTVARPPNEVIPHIGWAITVPVVAATLKCHSSYPPDKG